MAEDCVFHAAVAHRAVVVVTLGILDDDPLAQALPLFPNAAGETVSKEAVVATIEAIAVLLSEPLEVALGVRRFGGHSMRVSGAQWLGLLGFSVEHVKTFGRWASDTVVRYLGEAHVSDLARSRNRFIRERAVLEGLALPASLASGPQLCTPDEAERIVRRAVDQGISSLARQVDELRTRPARYDAVLHEGRRIAHASWHAT